jgi:hypothetical protein
MRTTSRGVINCGKGIINKLMATSTVSFGLAAERLGQRFHWHPTLTPTVSTLGFTVSTLGKIFVRESRNPAPHIRKIIIRRRRLCDNRLSIDSLLSQSRLSYERFFCVMEKVYGRTAPLWVDLQILLHGPGHLAVIDGRKSQRVGSKSALGGQRHGSTIQARV